MVPLPPLRGGGKALRAAASKPGQDKPTLVRAPDLEVYPESFQPDRPGAWVEWWIAVEG